MESLLYIPEKSEKQEDVPQETDPRYTLKISVTLFPANYEV